ncbi:hypothetical protein HT105_24720, partial [Bacteroides fragilis]|nr:hypothetical protein [Bacteroides fragilis]
IASNIKILSYRQGCLVVADWIEGTPLKTVAEDHNLDPKAVARALAPLVADIATAPIASNIKILSYRQGCLVVADWIEGTPLKTVAED